jgi:hypothetical protein
MTNEPSSEAHSDKESALQLPFHGTNLVEIPVDRTVQRLLFDRLTKSKTLALPTRKTRRSEGQPVQFAPIMGYEKSSTLDMHFPRRERVIESNTVWSGHRNE